MERSRIIESQKDVNVNPIVSSYASDFTSIIPDQIYMPVALQDAWYLNFSTPQKWSWYRR